MKTIRLRTAAVVAFSIVLLLAVLTTAWAVLSKGAKSPDFRLKSIDGRTLSLSQIRKDPAKPGAYRVVILDFWATWCGPCREELPGFQKLHEKYGKKGLAMVGVAVDKGGVSDVKPFVKENKLTYTILVDPRQTVKNQYGVRFLPTTYIIDKSGVIRAVHVGYAPGVEDTIENEVKSLLK